MNYHLIPKELRPIAEKVEAQQRISETDALSLYGANDLNALGIIANVMRERKNGNCATYIHNRYINYSNICILSCQFCAFARKKRDADGFELRAPLDSLSSADLIAAAEGVRRYAEWIQSRPRPAEYFSKAEEILKSMRIVRSAKSA